jgi:hypothetical protein
MKGIAEASPSVEPDIDTNVVDVVDVVDVDVVVDVDGRRSERNEQKMRKFHIDLPVVSLLHWPSCICIIVIVYCIHIIIIIDRVVEPHHASHLVPLGFGH